MKPRQVKSLRKKLGLPQEQLASLLGLSFATVNRWENGQTTPSGLGLILLQLLTEVVVLHPAETVVSQLRQAPNQLAVVKLLVTLSLEKADEEPDGRKR